MTTLYCSACDDVIGYWLYNCPICDDIWGGEDPLLKEEGPEECCGVEVDSGWVECCTCKE